MDNLPSTQHILAVTGTAFTWSVTFPYDIQSVDLAAIISEDGTPVDSWDLTVNGNVVSLSWTPDVPGFFYYTVKHLGKPYVAGKVKVVNV